MCGKGFDGDIDKPVHFFDVRAARLGRKQPTRRIPQVCVRGQDRGREFQVVTLIRNSRRNFRPTIDGQRNVGLQVRQGIPRSSVAVPGCCANCRPGNPRTPGRVPRRSPRPVVALLRATERLAQAASRQFPPRRGKREHNEHSYQQTSTSPPPPPIHTRGRQGVASTLRPCASQRGRARPSRSGCLLDAAEPAEVIR
jgi:hypothetical protein